MSARSFKSVGWVAGIGAAALTCYMFSLSVAAERAELSELEGEIVELQQSIRTLNTELGTRGRVHQLQHWASADFGFTAPVASQVLEDEVTLAQLEIQSEASPLEAPVRMASAPQPALTMPRVVQASASTPAPSPARPVVTAAAAPRTQEQPLLRRASVTRAPATETRAVTPQRTATAPQRPAATTPRRVAAQVTPARTPAPQTASPRAATRATSLLNDRTLRELSSRERSERGGRVGRESR